MSEEQLTPGSSITTPPTKTTQTISPPTNVPRTTAPPTTAPPITSTPTIASQTTAKRTAAPSTITPASTTPPNTSVSSVAGCNEPNRDVAGKKLKRLRFNSSFDIVLLKAVGSCRAHLAEWGQTLNKFEEGLALFVQAITASSSLIFDEYNKPSSKSPSDRFKRIIAERREECKRNAAASGIVEEYGEREKLMDDLIQEIDEKEEADRLLRDEREGREKRLLVADELLRTKALSRASLGNQSDPSTRANDNNAAKEDQNGGATTNGVAVGSVAGTVVDGISERRASNPSRRLTPTPTKSRSVSHDSDDEIQTKLQEDMVHRRKADDEKTGLEKQRLEMYRKRFDGEEEMFRKRISWLSGA